MIAEMYMLRYAGQSGALFFDSVVFVECFYDRRIFASLQIFRGKNESGNIPIYRYDSDAMQ